MVPLWLLIIILLGSPSLLLNSTNDFNDGSGPSTAYNPTADQQFFENIVSEDVFSDSSSNDSSDISDSDPDFNADLETHDQLIDDQNDSNILVNDCDIVVDNGDARDNIAQLSDSTIHITSHSMTETNLVVNDRVNTNVYILGNVADFVGGAHPVVAPDAVGVTGNLDVVEAHEAELYDFGNELKKFT